jgi:hypothetical protein
VIDFVDSFAGSQETQCHEEFSAFTDGFLHLKPQRTILAIPITAGLSAVAAAGTIAAGVLSAGAVGAGAAAIDAKWWKDKFGIPEDFVQEVGSMLQPYDSAIFALLRTAKPNEVIEHFRGYGGVGPGDYFNSRPGGEVE